MHLIKISVVLTMLGARTDIGWIAVNPLKTKQIEKLIYPSGWPLGLLDKIYQKEAMWHIFSQPPYTSTVFTLRIRQRKPYNTGNYIQR